MPGKESGIMSRRVKEQNQNNAGSAIVTVLVVVTFITILATVLLYISGLNFQMKVTDYRTKESFYQAEIPVEELRAQLAKDVQIAFAKAYTAAMSEYSGLGNEEARVANYRQRFCDELNRIWKERSGVDPSGMINWKEGIKKVVEPATGEEFWDVEVTAASGWDTSRAVSHGQVILRGVTFKYDSANHYGSIISTDYCVSIPQINWSGSFEAAGTVDETLDFSGCVNYMNWTKQ